ncbi:MAG: Ferredoxin--NADP reductase [Dehalococcoidia bacterium]|nr:Ferredoxin--NADP reductase [Dehalococcoidia bacterium]
MELPKATVVRRKDLTADLMLVWLAPEIPFTFEPGQYCTIGLEGIERAYSIASGPHEPGLELFVELVPEGPLTARLWKLREGDQVSIRPRAKGLFLMEDRYPNHLMVSTVTGVVPFISIVRSYLHQSRGGHHFYVLQGASYCDEFAYREELEKLASSHPQTLTYLPTVSRPQEERNRGWKGQTGRVNLVVEKCIGEFGLPQKETLVYACGHPGMIEDVKARLTPKGFKIKEERFWKQ